MVAAAGDQPDQTFGAALVKLDFAGGECGEHHAIALDVSELGIHAMLSEQALIVRRPKRREAAADRRVANGDGREFLVLRSGERCEEQD